MIQILVEIANLQKKKKGIAATKPNPLLVTRCK